MQTALYPEEAIRPMREELEAVGFEGLATPGEVDRVVRETPGTLMCVINSVCGCAGGAARPGIALALQHKVIPDRLVTVFAGMEREAVDRVRELHAPLAAPSSPSVVLFQGGRVVSVMERRHIQNRSPEEVAADLTAAFDRLCRRPGPSIPAERFSRLDFPKVCGSKIPKVPPPDAP